VRNISKNVKFNIRSVIGPGGPEIVGGVIQVIANANPSLSPQKAQILTNDLVLRTANNAEQPDIPT